VRHVEDDAFHPPLMEFFPAFTADGFLYAPATSVALNRNFNALFRAPLERAEDPAAWSLAQHGSLWHTENVEAEHFGIWGQTFSGFVARDKVLRVMFPSRDADGRGTINLAQRPWKRPFQKRGFVLTAHSGPSLTLLRSAYPTFTLDAQVQLHGTASLLLDYDAPLGPNAPTSDATLHPLASTRHLALQLEPGRWSLLRVDASARTEELDRGPLPAGLCRTVHLDRQNDLTTIRLDGREVWARRLPSSDSAAPSGVLGIRVEKDSHLTVNRFRIKGQPKKARMVFLHTEALLGAGASDTEWEESRDSSFRFGVGAVSRQEKARAKWNVLGSGLRFWSPRGPEYGTIQLRLDGRIQTRINLHADQPVPSEPIWAVTNLPDTIHAVVLEVETGPAPLDCLEVTSGPHGR
jgi:hypothetical protein